MLPSYLWRIDTCSICFIILFSFMLPSYLWRIDTHPVSSYPYCYLLFIVAILLMKNWYILHILAKSAQFNCLLPSYLWRIDTLQKFFLLPFMFSGCHLTYEKSKIHNFSKKENDAVLYGAKNDIEQEENNWKENKN